MSTVQRGQIRFAPITNTAGAGTFTLVPAVAGQSVVVIGFCLMLTGTTPTLIFQDDAANALSGAFSGTTSTITCMGSRIDPIMATAKGQAFQMVLTGTSAQARGFMVYCLEDAQ